MSCKNETSCEILTKERYARMQPHLHAAIERLDRFRQAYEKKDAVMAFDEHASFREIWRSFAGHQVEEAVLNGDVIECRKMNGEYGFLIWYNVKIGRGQYRPMHVLVIMPTNNEKYLTIRTVYDPRSMAWRWADNYSRRICQCKED